MTYFRHGLITAVCLAMSGCATVATVPVGFDRASVSIVASDAATVVAADGPSGKGDAARTGALVGGGSGVLYSGLACAATGPFVALCLGAVTPAMVVISAGGGAAAGAVMAESAADLAFKRGFLGAQLKSTPNPQARLMQRLREQSIGESPSEPSIPTEWAATVGLTKLAAGSGHQITVEGTLNLRRAGSTADEFSKTYTAGEKVELTLGELPLGGLGASDAKAQLALIDQALNKALDKLALAMRHDLRSGHNASLAEE